MINRARAQSQIKGVFLSMGAPTQDTEFNTLPSIPGDSANSLLQRPPEAWRKQWLTWSEKRPSTCWKKGLKGSEKGAWQRDVLYYVRPEPPPEAHVAHRTQTTYHLQGCQECTGEWSQHHLGGSRMALLSRLGLAVGDAIANQLTHSSGNDRALKTQEPPEGRKMQFCDEWAGGGTVRRA